MKVVLLAIGTFVLANFSVAQQLNGVESAKLAIQIKKGKTLKQKYKDLLQINDAKVDSILIIEKNCRESISVIKRDVNTLHFEEISPKLKELKINEIEQIKSILTAFQFQEWEKFRSHRKVNTPRGQSFMNRYPKINIDTLKHRYESIYHVTDQQANFMIEYNNQYIAQRKNILNDSSVKQRSIGFLIANAIRMRRENMLKILSPQQYQSWEYIQKRNYEERIDSIRRILAGKKQLDK